MNQAMNQLGAQSWNLHQGLTVAAIHLEPRMKDVEVNIFTHVGVITGDDGPWQPVRLTRKKNVSFDIATEKDTFFETK